MDYVTRQFINLTKKFRKDLHSISRKLNSALDKQTEAIRTAKSEQSPPPEITVFTKVPESIEIHQNAEDTTEERRYKHRMFFLSFVSLCALVFYTTLVYMQLRTLIDATSATEHAVQEARLNRLQADKAFSATVEQFRLDQRAWLGYVLKTRTYSHPNLRTNPADFMVVLEGNLINSGKTPATDTEVRISIVSRKPGEVIPTVESDEAAELRNEKKKLDLLFTKPGFETMPKTERDKIIAQHMQALKMGREPIFCGVVAPGAACPVNLSFGDMSNTGNDLRYWLLKVTYRVLFDAKHLHHTSACFVAGSSHPLEPCATGNTMD